MKTIFLIAFFTTLQAIVSTFFSIFMAFPLSYIFYRFQFPLKKYLISLIFIFFIMPSKLLALCLSETYNVSGFTGIILAHIILNLPFAFYLIYLKFKELDEDLILMAQQFGACSFDVFKDVYIPFLSSTVISIAIIIFSYCFASFSIPLVLKTGFINNTLETMAFEFYQSSNISNALSYSFLQFFILLSIHIFCHVKIKNFDSRFILNKIKLHSFYNNRLLLLYLIFILFFFSLVFFAILKPIFHPKVVYFFENFFSNNLNFRINRIIGFTFLISFISNLIAILLGFIFSYFYIYSSFSFKKIINGINSFPFICGHLIIGFLFSYLAKLFNYNALFSYIFSHIFLHYPIAFAILKSNLGGFNKNLQMTALSLGASNLYVLRTIILSMLIPSIISCFTLTFCLSMTEIGAGSIVESKDIMTLAVVIRILRQNGNYYEALALSYIVLIIVFICTFIQTNIKRRFE